MTGIVDHSMKMQMVTVELKPLWPCFYKDQKMQSESIQNLFTAKKMSTVIKEKD